MTSTPLRSLNLELLHPAALRQRRGLFFLLVGAVLVLGMTGRYMVVQQKIAVMESAASRDMGVVRGESDVKFNADEIKVARDGIGQLVVPWGALFTALESIDTGKITLLSVEPDAHSGTVKIVAEAPDAYGMLDCVRGLVQQPTLRAVRLLAYEVRDSDPNQPTRFTVTAFWMPMS